MKILFDQLEKKIIPEFRGGKKNTIARMYVDENIKIMHGTLEPGASIGLHTHDTSSEIIYILHGKGKVLYNDTTETIAPGECHYCPKGQAHSLINDSNSTDLEFFAVVPEQ